MELIQLQTLKNSLHKTIDMTDKVCYNSILKNRNDYEK